MTVHYLDLFSNQDRAKGGEEGEEVREGVLASDHLVGNMVYFESIGEVAYADAIGCIGMRDYDHLSSEASSYPLSAIMRARFRCSRICETHLVAERKQSPT